MKMIKTKHDAVISIMTTLHLQKEWIDEKKKYWKSNLARVIIENLIRDGVIDNE